MHALDTATVYSLLFTSLYFEVFLLITFLERHLHRHDAPLDSGAELPSVTIVVPCFNEERTVAATLASLFALEYPTAKLEIIVVDDGSTDRTYETAALAARAAGAGKPRITLLQKANGGKHTAMNLALGEVRTDLVGCLDADSEVAPDALRAIVPAFADPQIGAVTPAIHVKKPQTLLQHMQHVEYRLSIFVRFVLSALGSAFITPGPFSIFRADLVKRLGGWRHGHSTEDMEMALRIQEAGFLIGNAPGANVRTTAPRRFKHLFRQRVRWTYGFLRNASDYRSLFLNRRFGNLGLFILPLSLASIGTGLFFFFRILYYLVSSAAHVTMRTIDTGLYPQWSFSLSSFYLATSMMWFLIYIAITLILILISAGTVIATNKRTLPSATPLFLFCYSFLVPLWLGAALVRATLKTGVEWR